MDALIVRFHGRACCAALMFLLLSVVIRAGVPDLCHGTDSKACAIETAELEDVGPSELGLSLLQGIAHEKSGGGIQSPLKQDASSNSSSGRSDSGLPFGLPLGPLACPRVSVFPNLDLAEYTRATWYVQEQQTVAYQSSDQLDCVVATYNLSGSTIPFFNGQVVDIFNWYAGGANNGNDSPFQLCGASNGNAKLSVAPCFLPKVFGGDYWVLHVAESPTGKYEWAIISGGNPNLWYPNGCTTFFGRFAYYNAGLWIFSRVPELPADQLQEARKKLQDLGFTTEKMLKVKQAGCDYNGAYIKP